MKRQDPEQELVILATEYDPLISRLQSADDWPGIVAASKELGALLEHRGDEASQRLLIEVYSWIARASMQIALYEEALSAASKGLELGRELDLDWYQMQSASCQVVIAALMAGEIELASKVMAEAIQELCGEPASTRLGTFLSDVLYWTPDPARVIPALQRASLAMLRLKPVKKRSRK